MTGFVIGFIKIAATAGTPAVPPKSSFGSKLWRGLGEGLGIGLSAWGAQQNVGRSLAQMRTPGAMVKPNFYNAFRNLE